MSGSLARFRLSLPRGFSATRVFAMVERHLYLLRASPVRLIDLIYWPTVQLLTWSFLQLYVGRTSQLPVLAAGTLIGGILLWDVLFRGQLGFSMSFLEEVWSRNLGHLLMSPLRPAEFVASLMIMSVLRLMIGLVPAVLIATTFFGFDLAALSLVIPFLFVNLMLTSWSVGLVTSGLILRNGLAAETIAWSAMFAMMPFACISYPVSTLPESAAADRLGAAADLCVRGDARHADREEFSPGPPARILGAQPRLDRARRLRVPRVARGRAPGGIAPRHGRASGQRMMPGRAGCCPNGQSDVHSFVTELPQ